MPISHLLSESFFVERQEHNKSQLSQLSELPEHHPTGRHVQFKDEDKHQDLLEDDRIPDAYYEQGNGPSGMDQLQECFNMCTENPVLIDTDGGIYDAWAIALALRAAEMRNSNGASLDIVGITTVNGIATVEAATRNVCRIVDSFNRTGAPIPIFRGMESPLVKSPGSETKRPSFFGSDGYGDVEDLPIPHSKVKSVHGVMAIIKMAERYKGKLTILALGPLTNIAMAGKLNPDIRHFIKEIFIVGGNSEGIGNMTVASEFNFHVDPEAANLVLETFNSCPVFVLPWETCLRSATLSQSFRINAISNMGSSEMDLLNKIEQKFLSNQNGQWIVPDAVLMACFLNREMIRKSEHFHCTVETQGKHTRGMMVVDKNFIRQHPANVILITDVNRKMFGKMLIWAMGQEIDVQRGKERDREERIEIEQNYF